MIAGLVDRLAWASVAIALMVAVAWIVCRLRPSLAPSTRSTIWWLVAAAALLRMAPVPGLTLEVSAQSRLAAFLPAETGAATVGWHRPRPFRGRKAGQEAAGSASERFRGGFCEGLQKEASRGPPRLSR